MKRSSARARRLPVVNLWLGLIIDWIFSLSPDDMLSCLLSISLPCRCFSSRLPPSVPRSFSPAGKPASSFAETLYLRRISFFSPLFLPSSFPASRATPYPSFLLARLTKMGPAASGSRFPRKLSSYKINYPLYFIAPRRSRPGCASTWARAVSFLFLPLPVPARRRDEFLTNWIALRTEMRISEWSWSRSRPFPSFAERFAGKVMEDRKSTTHFLK